MEKSLFGEEIPMGLGMALAMNTDAMARFSEMSESQRRQVIIGCQSIRSKDEMHSYVKKLEKGTVFPL